MKGYTANIEEVTLANSNFRQVLYTGKHMQLVVMSLLPGEEIGAEVHETVDQFFRVEAGTLKFVVDAEETLVAKEGVYIVPAGSMHNVINVGSVVAKVYTIYTPPEHPDGTVHTTKVEADEAEAAEHH